MKQFAIAEDLRLACVLIMNYDCCAQSAIAQDVQLAGIMICDCCAQSAMAQVAHGMDYDVLFAHAHAHRKDCDGANVELLN